MCDCFTNPNGDKVFCSILCRDYYIGQNPDRAWRYYCKWCSTGKTLKMDDWCSKKCIDEDKEDMKDKEEDKSYFCLIL